MINILNIIMDYIMLVNGYVLYGTEYLLTYMGNCMYIISDKLIVSYPYIIIGTIVPLFIMLFVSGLIDIDELNQGD